MIKKRSNSYFKLKIEITSESGIVSKDSTKIVKAENPRSALWIVILRIALIFSSVTNCSNVIFNLYIANNMINSSEPVEDSCSKQYWYESSKIDHYSIHFCKYIKINLSYWDRNK